MTRRLTIPLLAATLLLLAAAAVSLSGETLTARAAAGDRSFVHHPTLVPVDPERNYPKTLSTPHIGEFPRQSYAVDLIDGYVISGGDFLSVEKPDGTVVSQEYLAIYDSSTKQLQCESLTVDDEVHSLAPGPFPRTAIIGGKFDRVQGADGVQRTRNKVALIHLDTCEVNRNWIVNGLNGNVIELAVSGDRLFLGGDFTSIDGQPIGHLAEVDHTTGELNPAMKFSFTGGIAPARRIVGLEANEAGTRLGVVHRSTSINNIPMRGTAVINISNPTAPSLTRHRLSASAKAYTYYYDIQDGAIDPDFTYFALAQGTATVSDYVTRVNVTEAPNQFVWQHFMHDSSFGIAASNNAIYVGGHFCQIESGPGPTATMTPNTLDTCTGNFFGGVWRSQLAALDPSDGTPLEWNPGNDSRVGARALTVVSRGLLVGYDGSFTHGTNGFNNVGTTAFFDFGADQDPTPVGPTCTATANADNTITVDWTTATGITDYQVRRLDLNDPAGTVQWRATVDAAPYTWDDNPGPGNWQYQIRYRQGGVQDVICNPNITVG